MKLPYAWNCLACATTNEPSATRCVACGLASRATGSEIEAAKHNLQNPGLPRKIPSRDVAAQIESALAPLPLAGKLLTIFLGLVVLVAFVVFHVTFSFVIMGIALLAGFIALLLLVMLVAGAGRKPSNSTLHQPASDA